MNKIIVPRNRLKEKVGSGGFTEESIARAQQQIENNVVDFQPIATEYLKGIRLAITAFRVNGDAKHLYSELLDKLTQLRAQGSMFHYSAITKITDIVVNLLDSLDHVDEKIILIIDSYEKCASVILRSGIRDEASAECRAVATELKQVCEKYRVKFID